VNFFVPVDFCCPRLSTQTQPSDILWRGGRALSGLQDYTENGRFAFVSPPLDA